MSVPSVDAFAFVAQLQGVPAALAAARDGIDVLLRDRGLRRTAPATTAESLLRGAVASARLEGSDCTLAQARAGDADPLAERAVRLNAGLLALAPVVARSPLQAFAAIHALAAAGAVPVEQVGRPCSSSAAEVLQRLAARLIAPTTAPAVAVAALAHVEILVNAPFGSADGLVARAVERLLLVARGVDPASVTVPEVGHLRLRSDYESALTAYRIGGPAGRQTWLLHAAAALGLGVAASPLAATERP